MAGAPYSFSGIVLRKTKLGESDLIITFLSEDGSISRCVAKGARKPSSSFASRLELYSEVDVLCAPGRNLGIVKEARLKQANDTIRSSFEHATAAAPMAELLGKVAQEGLENEVLYLSTCVALSALDGAPASVAPAICAAHLLKTLAYAGLRPNLAACVLCGGVPESVSGQLLFSFSEGGLVCASCRSECESQPYSEAALSWSRFLLVTPFAKIVEAEPSLDAGFSALRLAQGLIRAHVGGNLKALEFMFSCGLYDS